MGGSLEYTMQTSIILGQGHAHWIPKRWNFFGYTGLNVILTMAIMKDGKGNASHGGGFMHYEDNAAFGFLNPALIIWAIHLIPCFALGWMTLLLPKQSICHLAEEKDEDWDMFYVRVYLFMTLFVVIKTIISPLSKKKKHKNKRELKTETRNDPTTTHIHT